MDNNGARRNTSGNLFPSVVLIIPLRGDTMNGVDIKGEHTLKLGLFAIFFESNGMIGVDWNSKKKGLKLVLSQN